jgi:hypothetical protein
MRTELQDRSIDRESFAKGLAEEEISFTGFAN